MEEQKLNKKRAGGAKSPRYPVISLKGAISKVEKVYNKEYQVQCSREVIIENMGYNGVSGTSGRALSALKQYGLLVGRGDRMQVSDLAVAIIAHQPGTPEWSKAIREAAGTPHLFKELDERFDNGKGSDANIRSYLLTHNFIPRGVEKAIRAYRQTKDFLDAEGVDTLDNDDVSSDRNHSISSGRERVIDTAPESAPMRSQQEKEASPSVNSRRMVYALDEGDVTIEFPQKMTAGSVEELEQYINIFLAKLKKQTGDEPEATEVLQPENIDRTELGHSVSREREAKGLSKEELASQAGVSPEFVEGLENGEKSLDWGKILFISGLLGISIYALSRSGK